MADFKDTPLYKYFCERYYYCFKETNIDEYNKQFKSDDEFEAFIKAEYTKKLNYYEEQKKLFPSPEYMGYDELEVGKIYHIVSGFNHTPFKIHERLDSEQGLNLYVYTLVKCSDHMLDMPESTYTTKYNTGAIDQMFARYKEGVWPSHATIIDV